LLQQAPRRGTVIDLGCGAGDLAGPVCEAGFDYLGIDLSPDMIALARSRFPEAQFREGSAFDLAEVEGVTAIVAVGEVINYATDPRAGIAGLAPFLRHCRELLGPGGVLLMDVAGPLRADPEPATQIDTTADYRLKVTVVTDPARQLLRRTITIEDARGRDSEVHELHLIEPLEVMAALRNTGFTATALDRYTEDLPFPRGWSAFLARVPD
jgi:SAM-dependent methyltransferase